MYKFWNHLEVLDILTWQNFKRHTITSSKYHNKNNVNKANVINLKKIQIDRIDPSLILSGFNFQSFYIFKLGINKHVWGVVKSF